MQQRATARGRHRPGRHRDGSHRFTPVRLGVRFHVSAASSLLLTLSSRSDEAGLGLTALPIPADAGLQCVRLYAQAVWIEDAANGQASSRAALGLVASRGLEVTVQQ